MLRGRHTPRSLAPSLDQLGSACVGGLASGGSSGRTGKPHGREQTAEPASARDCPGLLAVREALVSAARSQGALVCADRVPEGVREDKACQRGPEAQSYAFAPPWLGNDPRVHKCVPYKGLFRDVIKVFHP